MNYPYHSFKLATFDDHQMSIGNRFIQFIHLWYKYMKPAVDLGKFGVSSQNNSFCFFPINTFISYGNTIF
jgi:hypothetical protein